MTAADVSAVSVDLSGDGRTVTQRKLCSTQACPCEVSEWSPPTACDMATGTTRRTRTITKQGPSCPPLEAITPCPVSCVIGNWSAWTDCSATCGPGKRTRTAPITRNPLNGGTTCEVVAGGGTVANNVITQTQDCTGVQCPASCQLGPWSPWSPCSVSCGAGTQTRMATITRQPLHGGADCSTVAGGGVVANNVVTQTQECMGPRCPVSCRVSPITPASQRVSPRVELGTNCVQVRNVRSFDGEQNRAPGSALGSLAQLPSTIDKVPGWSGDAHENPGGKVQSAEACRQQALANPKYVAWGYRTPAHPDPSWQNTCFLYTAMSQFPGNAGDTAHETGCLQPGQRVASGCKHPQAPARAPGRAFTPGTLLRRHFPLNSMTASLSATEMNAAFRNPFATSLAQVPSFEFSGGNFIGLEFTGWFIPTSSGIYTFGSLSDDGSDMALYINNAWDIITNAYGYRRLNRRTPGTRNLTAFVPYPIRIRFHKQDGGETLNLFWIPPGADGLTPIPFSVFQSTPTILAEGFPNPAV